SPHLYGPCPTYKIMFSGGFIRARPGFARWSGLRILMLGSVNQYGPRARAILIVLLDKYADFGPGQLSISEALQVPPISEQGNVMEIAELFGGAPRMKQAVERLQALLYQG
ncbi:type I restriction-modification enzyme R subunit C-terminal domain-containing protein, partial [Candidatus Thiosymbion oneisti]|uniref:type I restriction-modification enzyme R subunit C-terminal domain-containing protein n=1 Tax=Candidatus Thiosymbion oneisti TaxID=589554 RepID=UPI00114CDC04